MKNYIPSLNGLRAISIFCVLFSHIEARNFGKHDAPGGQIGVNIFFIISGYLITLLLLREEKANGVISLKDFFIRRVLRIFPVYYCLLAIYFILQKFDVLYFTPNSWLLSLTYTKYFPVANGSEWETGHLWSLSVEEHFYLVWPVIFCLLRPIRIYFSIIIILAVTITRLFSDLNELTILTRADALMIGVLFAMFNEKITHFVNLVINKNKFTIFIPFIALFVCITFKRIFGLNGNEVYKPIILAFAGSYGLLTNLSVALLIVVSINARKTLWYRFLNLNVVNYVGILSYSIYIWQQIFFSPKIAPLSQFPMNLLYIFIAANISYHFIEKPFLNLKSKFIKQKSINKGKQIAHLQT